MGLSRVHQQSLSRAIQRQSQLHQELQEAIFLLKEFLDSRKKALKYSGALSLSGAVSAVGLVASTSLAAFTFVIPAYFGYKLFTTPRYKLDASGINYAFVVAAAERAGIALPPILDFRYSFRSLDAFTYNLRSLSKVISLFQLRLRETKAAIVVFSCALVLPSIKPLALPAGFHGFDQKRMLEQDKHYRLSLIKSRVAFELGGERKNSLVKKDNKDVVHPVYSFFKRLKNESSPADSVKKVTGKIYEYAGLKF